MRHYLNTYTIFVALLSLTLSGCWAPPPGATPEQIQQVNNHNTAVTLGVVGGVVGGLILGTAIKNSKHDDRHSYPQYRERRGYYGGRYYRPPQRYNNSSRFRRW